MLLARRTLQAIVDRRVSLVFRRWRRAGVRAGTRLHTEVGMLHVESVDIVKDADISEADARAAGHASRQELLAELEKWPDGKIHRVRVRFAGEDPRIALRKDDDLSFDQLAEIVRRLDRLDAASTRGPWTCAMLETIAAHPEKKAADLCEIAGCDKEVLKLDVRKLKNLGLTESLQPGYRLSPRGRAVLGHLKKRGS